MTIYWCVGHFIIDGGILADKPSKTIAANVKPIIAAAAYFFLIWHFTTVECVEADSSKEKGRNGMDGGKRRKERSVSAALGQTATNQATAAKPPPTTLAARCKCHSMLRMLLNWEEVWLTDVVWFGLVRNYKHEFLPFEWCE